jgi:hypothetical protein
MVPAVGVDQRPVKVGPAVAGLGSRVTTDDVMKKDRGRRVEVMCLAVEYLHRAALMPGLPNPL